MDTTDDEEQVVTKDPIETDKPSPSATAPIKTYKPSPIYPIHMVVIRAPVEIVTKAPIEKWKHHFNLLILHFSKC